ncbi:MAG: hypothetical protein U0359_24160 [Byssovorax sp.]
MTRAARRRPSPGAAAAGLAAVLFALGCGASSTGSGSSSTTTGAGGATSTAGTGGESASGGAGGQGGAPMLQPITALQIAAGRAHACALVAGGTVACWGAGEVGQLGDGLSGKDHHRSIPVVVTGLSGVKAIRAGGDSTCALIGDGGKIRCWGAGGYGQLGNGKAMDQYFEPSPVEVGGVDGAVDVSVSGVNACAVLTGGSVRCWGKNDAAAWLGFSSADCGPYVDPDGTGNPTPVSIPCESTPKEVAGIADAKQISIGGAHVCAVRMGGAVSCWGADGFGQLGDGTFGPDNHKSTPTPIADLTGVELVHAGTSHTCALVADQKVACWGDNAHGQLGIGTDALDSYKTVPTPVPGLGAVIGVGVSGRTTCAITDDRLVHCWGDAVPLFPVPPDPTKQSVLSPATIPDLAFVIEARPSATFACAKKATNNVVCWGAGDEGQLGNGTTKATDFSFATVAN